MTAAFYMILSVPIGRLADRVGRRQVLLSGYATLFMIYLMIASGTFVRGFPLIPLVLFGLFYAATEGVLTAMASATIPAPLRTSGLAVLTTVIGFAKMVSSIAFGWFWQMQSTGFAVIGFAAMLAIAFMISTQLFWTGSHDRTPQS
jgi:MFS family permease